MLNFAFVALLCFCGFFLNCEGSSYPYYDEVDGNGLIAGAGWSNGDLRLVGSSNFISDEIIAGRLEVYFDMMYYGSGAIEGEWGTVCGLKFGMTEASVACRQLGYSTAISWDFAIDTEFGIANESAPIWLSGLQCSRSTQLHMLRCNSNGIGLSAYCQHIHDVALYCSNEKIWSNPYQGQVRLINSEGGANSSVSYGRVEVYQGEQWGTVCGRQFSQTSADSVCRQLGYTSAGLIQPATTPSSGIIWVEEITCQNSSQACFTSCFTPQKSSINCNHSEDVEVKCIYDVAEGSTNSAGNRSQCRIQGFQLVFAIIVGVVALSCLAVVGLLSVLGFIVVRRLHKKYTSRYYEELH